MTNYPIGDFLIKIKNAALANQKEVVAESSNKIKAVALCLKKAGFLDEVKVNAGTITAVVTFKNKKPLLFGLKLISKPGLRVYKNAAGIADKKGPSVFLISTSHGVLTSKEAIKAGVGGELIAEVW